MSCLLYLAVMRCCTCGALTPQVPAPPRPGGRHAKRQNARTLLGPPRPHRQQCSANNAGPCGLRVATLASPAAQQGVAPPRLPPTHGAGQVAQEAWRTSPAVACRQLSSLQRPRGDDACNSMRGRLGRWAYGGWCSGEQWAFLMRHHQLPNHPYPYPPGYSVYNFW